MKAEDLEIGTFGVQCRFCDLVIPCPVTVSPQAGHHATSISLSANVDVSHYEAHLEAHEGEDLFDE